FPAGLSAVLTARSSDTQQVFYVEPSYVFATPVLGGQAAVTLSTSYGRDASGLAATLTGSLAAGGAPAPVASAAGLVDTVWGFGDISPVASLRWNSGVNNFMIYGTGNIPVGAYDAARLANLGIGHGAIDAGGAYSYYDEKSGHEFSGTFGFTYNLIN